MALPGGSVDQLRSMLANARELTSEMRHQRSGTENTRRRRPGPTARKIRLRYYLLPTNGQVPILSGDKDQALIAAHHQCNYGFPNGDSKKKHSCLISLNTTEYFAFLSRLYNLPATTRFLLYKCDKRKNLSVVDHHNELHGYGGVIFLKIDSSDSASDDDSIDLQADLHMDIERAGVPTNEEHTTETLGRQPQETTAPIPTQPTEVLALRQPTTQIVLPQLPSVQRIDLTNDDPVSPDIAARRFVIHDQDIQFATSLQGDRDRDRHRREARARLSLRSRQRRERIARETAEAEQMRVNVIESLGPEPDTDDSFLLSFRCPDPDVNISRRFRPTDTCRVVCSYVVASVGKACTIHGPHGVLINSEITLEASGITQNTRFNVDETNAESNSDSESVGDDNFLDAPSSPIPSQEPQHESLEQKCERVRDNLLPEKTVLVRRDNLIEDVLDAYRANDGLEHHNVRMEIDGEPALDASGVKREVYSMFFMQVFLQCFVGNCEVMPEMNPEFICSDLFVLIGKIMAHAFVLVGYFPIRFCKAAMITMITGSCSAETIMSSFLSYVSASQKAVIQKATQNDPLSCEEKLVLFSLFNDFGMTRTPDRQKYRDCVYKVAEMCCIYRSLGAMGKICQGITVYSGLWTNIKESDITELYHSMRPTVPEVLSRIKYEFSDHSITLRTAEERIKDYLEVFIEDHVGDEGLPKLLQYWTASNILVVPTLHVSFTSQEGVGRCPFVNSCIAQLNLSRMFVSCDEFVHEFKCYLNSREAQEFDSI